MSEKTVKFWQTKKEAAGGFIIVFKDADTPLDGLSPDAKKAREEYFETAKLAWVALKDALLQLHKEIIGPYALGKTPRSDLTVVSTEKFIHRGPNIAR